MNKEQEFEQLRWDLDTMSVQDIFYAGWQAKDEEVSELKERLSDVLKWRGLDGDGITDPLRKRIERTLEE